MRLLFTPLTFAFVVLCCRMACATGSPDELPDVYSPDLFKPDNTWAELLETERSLPQDVDCEVAPCPGGKFILSILNGERRALGVVRVDGSISRPGYTNESRSSDEG